MIPEGDRFYVAVWPLFFISELVRSITNIYEMFVRLVGIGLGIGVALAIVFNLEFDPLAYIFFSYFVGLVGEFISNMRGANSFDIGIFITSIAFPNFWIAIFLLYR